MRFFLVSFGLYTLLAAATSSAVTQAIERGSACQQETGRYNYEHPTMGKFIDLTQTGLELIRAEAGETTPSAASLKACPEAKVGVLSALKKWFKKFTDQTAENEELYGNMTEEEKALYRQLGGHLPGEEAKVNQVSFSLNGHPLENPVHLIKNGAFQASLYMTQDGEKILSNAEDSDLKKTISIVQGEQVEALLLFRGCTLDEADNCFVTADYVIKAPDGSIFHEQLNTDVWKEPIQSAKQFSLTNTRVGFLAPADADTGAYKFQVSLYDKISSKEISLTGQVDVFKDSPENGRKAESTD